MFIPNKVDGKKPIARPTNYVVYGWQRSYFTHKLMAALHFYGADFEFRDKTMENGEEIQLRSGTHQIPVLHTPENWMISDTTPLLHMLDGRFADRRMFPEGPAGILIQAIEEYFDEWIARTTVHWRWNYPENHELLSMDAAQGNRDNAAMMIVWGGKVCRATGVSSDVQQKAAEDEYHRIMAAAEKQLGETRYLMGDRPTAVDCIVLAGLRAHFLFDPAPKAALYDRYPGVIKWVEETADRWDGVSGHLPDFPETTAFGKMILGEMEGTYQSFALGNAAALAKGDKAFVTGMYGEEVSYLARPYIEQSRQMLISRIKNDLSDTDKAAVLDWLNGAGLAKAFAPQG